jgi:muramoyltetrapeptide carboxypeptidase
MASEAPAILFIEDISEAIYAVERMLIRLRLAGQLDRVKGLVVGHFTEYRPDRNHPDMETMISRLLGDAPFPVAFGFPAGHTDDNLPLALGSKAILTVTPDGTSLSMS